MYSWRDIALRTEEVYNEIYQRTPLALVDRLKLYYGCGAWAGKLFCLLVALDFLLLCLLEFCYPREGIDIARDWPKKVRHGYEGGEEKKGRGKGKTGVRKDGGGRIARENMVNGTGKTGCNV